MCRSLVKPLFADVKTFVLDTLFPISCLGCGQEGAFICEQCLPELGKLEHQHCIVCQKQSIMGFTHPRCFTPHAADGLVSILNYHDETVANATIKGKYDFLPGVYEIFGKLLAKKLADEYGHLLLSAPILVPLPLHKSRKRWRGFNQAEILCGLIGKELNLPVVDVLTRVKSTKTQKDLKRDQRIKNVADAFALSPSPLARGDVSSASERQRGRTDDDKNAFDIHNQNLILVDDVTTTGSTLLAAAQVLKRNGAKTVWCLTIARD